MNPVLLSNKLNVKDIKGLAIWLDAADLNTITLSGNNVVAIADKSGNSNHAVQPVAANQPLYVANGINGKPALRGYPSGIQSKLNIADSSSLNYSEFTAFTVCQMNSYSVIQNNFIYGKYDTTGAQREFLHAISSAGKVGGFLSSNGTSFGFFEHTPLFPTNAARILNLRFQEANLYSKVLNSNDLKSAPVVSMFNGTSVYALFGRPSLADYFDGWIGEHLFFNRALNGDETDRVNSYLAEKWGI